MEFQQRHRMQWLLTDTNQVAANAIVDNLMRNESIKISFKYNTFGID